MNHNVESRGGDTIQSFIQTLPLVHTLFYTRAIRGGAANARGVVLAGFGFVAEKSSSIIEKQPQPKRECR